MFLQYTVQNAGWARVVVGSSSGYVDIPVSYLHDSLRDLGSAVVALSQGADQVTVTFVDEPGEHHLIATQQSSGVIEVEIRHFDDHPPRSLDRFRLTFQAQSTVAELRVEVLASMRNILETDGLEGYLSKWMNHPFPLDHFEQLSKGG
jgi:hypothetical protein